MTDDPWDAGGGWRRRAPRGLLDPEDPYGVPISTPLDRHWTPDFEPDSDDDTIGEHRQCLWCSHVEPLDPAPAVGTPVPQADAGAAEDLTASASWDDIEAVLRHIARCHRCQAELERDA